MSWSVIREIGVAYAPPSEKVSPRQLTYPIYAAQAADGTYLIVDELWAEKPLPFRLECRTVRVERDGEMIYDTWAHGIEDGYGCLVDDGSLAVLRRTKWELLLVSPQGTITRRLDLTNFSKRLPTTVSSSPQGTFVITFVDRARQLDIIEIDADGQLLWYLPSDARGLGVPGSVQPLPGGTLLVADGFCHAVVEMDRQGNVVWQYGEAGNPARALTRLAGPSSVRQNHRGERLIADTRNHRILRVDREGAIQEICPEHLALTDPTYADTTADGQLLICDGGNACVVQLDENQHVVWRYGPTLRAQRWLSYPRSVEASGASTYVIADTAHDRIIHVADDRWREIPPDGQAELFWPRCVRQLPSGSWLVADGRHGRIVELSTDGQVLRELRRLITAPPMGRQPSEILAQEQRKLTAVEGSKAAEGSIVGTEQPRKLIDPHDVRLLPNGHLLITDSPQNAVIEVDWAGHIHRLITAEQQCPLNDPHSAQQLDDGRLVICDTGHHRVLFVSKEGTVGPSLATIQAGPSVLRMNRPRYLEITADGTMVIVDTGHNRILLATLDGHLLEVIQHVPGSPIPHFCQPRWATLIAKDEIIIADHFHHRVLHLKKAAGDFLDGSP